MELGKLKAINIKLHDGLISSLDEISSRFGVNRSQLIRRVLIDYVEREAESKKSFDKIRSALG